jgi:hypothetical protein
MKRSQRISLVLLLTLLLISPVLGSSKQPRVQNEPEMLIKTVSLLEQKPLDKEVGKMREWALKWVIETDKVSVSVCSAMIAGLEEKYKYKSDVFMQYTLAIAAFKLANPDKANNEAATQLAGVESAIKFYDAILKEKPKAKSPFMDDLVTRRAAGSLNEYVATNSCPEKKETK